MFTVWWGLCTKTSWLGLGEDCGLKWVHYCQMLSYIMYVMWVKYVVSTSFSTPDRAKLCSEMDPLWCGAKVCPPWQQTGYLDVLWSRQTHVDHPPPRQTTMLLVGRTLCAQLPVLLWPFISLVFLPANGGSYLRRLLYFVVSSCSRSAVSGVVSKEVTAG